MGAVMRIVAILFVYLLLSVGDARASGEWNPISGTTPTKEMRNWIKYVVLGARTSVPPIVWLAPDQLNLGPLESLILLSKDDYGLVTKFTEQWTANTDCGKSDAKPWPAHTLEVLKHNEGGTEVCIVPQVAACNYLSAEKHIAGMTWSATKFAPIQLLLDRINCSASVEIPQR